MAEPLDQVVGKILDTFGERLVHELDVNITFVTSLVSRGVLSDENQHTIMVSVFSNEYISDVLCNIRIKIV